jgi:hypothetical protein
MSVVSQHAAAATGALVNVCVLGILSFPLAFPGRSFVKQIVEQFFTSTHL